MHSPHSRQNAMLFMLHIVVCILVAAGCDSKTSGETAPGDKENGAYMTSLKMASHYCLQHKIKEGFSVTDNVFTAISTCGESYYSEDDRKLICMMQNLHALSNTLLQRSVPHEGRHWAVRPRWGRGF